MRVLDPSCSPIVLAKFAHGSPSISDTSAVSSMSGNGSGGAVEEPTAAGFGDGGNDDTDVADVGVDAGAAIAPCDEIPTIVELADLIIGDDVYIIQDA